MNDETNKHVNVPSEIAGFSAKEVARAIRSIAYRKAYNNRPDVKQARKERNQRIGLAMRYIKQHPEVAL